MLNITWNLSRSQIADLWDKSAQQCINEIADSTKSVKILCCNFLYFGGRRDEYYSVYNPRVFIENELGIKPSHIIVLIDDIDRLDKYEIQAIFKLVKLTADFVNTIFVLAFDKFIVADALGEKYSDNNITGTINILNAASVSGIKNIVFSSSAAVFGEPDYLPVDEEHPKNPEN